MTQEAYWRFRDDIAGLADPRFYPIDWIDKQVWTGAIRTLANAGAIIGFEIKDYPGGARELHGMFAAGELESILSLIDQAIECGKSLGCTVATIASRSGWARLLESRGFGPHQQSIIKELG